MVVPYREVIIAKRRYPVRAKRTCTRFSAHSDIKRIYKTDHHRQHLVARQTFQANIVICFLAQLRQVFAELFDLGELLLLLAAGKSRVIDVLDSPGGIYPNGLKFAARARANAYLRPRRRDRERIYAFDLVLPFDGFPVAVEVFERLVAAALTPPPFGASALFDALDTFNDKAPSPPET